jgi:hypothetical protein
MRRSRILLIFSVVLTGHLISLRPVNAQDSIEVVDRKSNLFPAFQSAVLPGLGQVSQGKWLRGLVYLTGEAILAGDAIYYWENQYGRPGWDDAGRLFNKEVAYGLAAWYGMGAVFCALDAYYLSSQKRVRSPTLAVFQSLLFPGWGQLANGQFWKGAGIFVLQTSLAFSAYYQHENYLFYRRQNQFQEAEFYRDDRNRLIWWSVGALIFSAADAFVDSHLKDWDVSDELTVNPVYFPAQQTVGIGLQLQLGFLH